MYVNNIQMNPQSRQLNNKHLFNSQTINSQVDGLYRQLYAAFWTLSIGYGAPTNLFIAVWVEVIM